MSQTIPARIVIRRDTAANWTAADPVLLQGEWGFETDARKLKIGDGASTWAALSYFSTGSGGGGSGTVTSVGLSLPGLFSVSGSPVTATGTLTATLATQSPNLIWAGPGSGVTAAVPAFRALVAADLPTTTVTAGSYGSASSVSTFTVDAAGRLTAASSTAIAIASTAVSGLATVATSGSATDLATGTLPAARLPATAVTAGSYTYGSFTVDAAGRLTAASSGAAPVTSVTGTAPVVSSGGATPAISISAATISAAGSMSAADKTKLDGVATGATANSSDATLLARANHTGTQAGSTVTGAYTAAGLTMATARILGRTTATTGAVEEISIGANLTLTGGVLAATGGGGGGSPGGSTTQVQYNNAGAFAGAANVDIISDNLQLTAPGSTPAAAQASSVVVYPTGLADRFMLAMRGPTGAAMLLQPSIFSNNIMMFSPQSGTTGTGSNAFQTAWGSAGTVTHPAPDASSVANAGRRTNYANVAATTNQVLGVRMSTTAEMCYLRGNVAGTGGFFYFSRFRLTYPASTTRLFTGLQGVSATSTIADTDTRTGNYCGLQRITTDPSTGSGALNFVAQEASTKTTMAINLGADLVSSSPLLDFYMYCPSNGGTIFFRLDDVTNGVTYTNSTTANLPTATVMMSPLCLASNGTANVTVGTVAMSIYRIYVESAL